ncbi:2-amino-4-hydroxy-6-hydroxymethyldihydropteridine diphosphokinase [Endozoicomonas sp.]|uniref:2-amino-4-hydroxy-6- hydroxymethyldihydropteridine diphosphokinase n=1 Tax=Endozoicomonas sp. TaxID=1892382 RepID=UPI002884B4FD|nr:2-amino-4-hydroxy-6-hydroxymethyldihydropteridine diphosphokinase [Endozoicomonas sp.]
MAETAYIALGSNLEKPELQLQRAVDDIDTVSGMTVSACSRLYRSDPVGPPGQPDYCNAVVAVKTTLKPLQLLDSLQSIENAHGRIRSVRWGPRTLDLDILLYDNQIIESERLTVPHYQMHVRNFVLYPLLDIAPGLELPNGKKLKAMVDELSYQGLNVIAESYPWI